MSLRSKHFVSAMLAFALLGGISVAQEHLAGQTDFDRDIEQGPDRKSPSMFHRAARDTPAEQLSYAREMEAAKGNTRKVRKAYLALVHTWHGSAEAPKAQLSYAMLLEEDGKYRRAFDEFQYLIDQFPGEFPYQTIVEHQFRIANFIKGKRSLKILGLPGFSAPERAIPLFSAIVKNAPEWDRAAELQYQIGVLHEEDGAYSDAVDAYTAVLSAYGKSPFAASACYRKATCMRALALSRRHNEKGLRAAAAAYQDFLDRYPSHALVESAAAFCSELNHQLAGMYLERAVFYDKPGTRPEAALMAYQDLIKNFPASPLAADARRRIAELNIEIDGPGGRTPEQ